MDKFHSFFSTGVASLVHYPEDNREGHSFVDDAEGKDVDISIIELSIGPVHRQGIRPLYRYEL